MTIDSTATDASTAAGPFPRMLRAVILNTVDDAKEQAVTRDLLTQLDVQVVGAETLEDALRLSVDSSTDLLLIDVQDTADDAHLLDRLALLAPANRPRNVAFMSDHLDDNLLGLRRRISQTKVHLFVKPLHMHGLLSVLKKMRPAVAISAAN